MAERVTIAGLLQQLGEAERMRDEARDALKTCQAELEIVTGQRDSAQGLARELQVETDGQAARIRELAGQLRAYKGSATKARNEAALLKAALSPESRKIGALPPTGAPFSDESLARREAIDDAIAAGPVTLVFSDGRKEIRELAPLIVTGDAWRQTARGQVLQLKPLLEPGDMAKPVVEIAGVGLLNEAGEQIGWRGFPETVEVPRNGRVELPIGSIIF